MKWQAVLFDLDDTLYSRAEAFSQAVERLAEVYITPVVEEPVSLIADKITRFSASSQPGSRKPPELIAEQVKLNYPQISEPEPFLSKWFQDELIAQIKPDSALESVVAHLARHEVPWAVVTNADEFQLRKIDVLGLEIDRDRIVMSDVEGWAKPDVRLFNVAIERLGVRVGEEILMVGDNPAADIQGAKNAGLTAAWMSLGRRWREADYQPDIRLESLSDLLSHLD